MKSHSNPAVHSFTALQEGESLLFDEGVYLTFLEMSWPEGHLRVTTQRLLWQPFDGYPCQMHRAQIGSVSSQALLILMRTVITSTEGLSIAVLTRKARALREALARLMATPVA
jgi:hypothetical protein